LIAIRHIGERLREQRQAMEVFAIRPQRDFVLSTAVDELEDGAR